MVEIYVDADACPVKAEVERVADRHGLKTVWVTDGGLRPPRNPMIRMVVVDQGADAADDWIAAHIQAHDICICNDIPLAARCIEKDAHVLRPNGEPITKASVGMALATRNLMQDLRDQGAVSGGPRPFSQKDRSAFLNKLETLVQAAERAKS
ncbi:MAG: YaiI/YqxD family protein [Alphaproteobacteria bacterium]|nr:YaiI/YqxD family protein [Alphaproteobacteria bacterium]